MDWFADSYEDETEAKPHDLLLNWRELDSAKNPALAFENLRPCSLQPTFSSTAFKLICNYGSEMKEGSKLSNKIASHFGDDRHVGSGIGNY